MSRSGYTDDWEDQWGLICWRGAVASALRGKRGQTFLNEMLQALDGLQERKLIARELEADGAVCALGAVGKARGLDMADIDPEDSKRIAATFGISEAMAREIVYMNDDAGWGDTPEKRYERMHKWTEENIKAAPQPSAPAEGEETTGTPESRS